MRVAIVMGVHNALDYAKRTLEQIMSTTEDVPLVIVDDCSDEEVSISLKHYAAGARLNTIYLYNPKQQLFTRTYNRGIRIAYQRWKPDLIVCVNSDLELKAGWLDWLIKGFANPSVGMVGYRDQFDPTIFSKKSYTEQKRPEYVTGHCLALRVKMLEEIGVFCETDITGRDSPELAPFKGQAHIGSDRILSWRANLAGWKTMYCNYPGCSHEAGKSWNHDLSWLSSFNLDPLWEPCDTLEEPKRYDDPSVCGAS